MIDQMDLSILRALASNGRATYADLGNRLGLSRQSVAERVARLERAGVILGYAPSVRAEAVGAGLTAFVAVSIERPEHNDQFLSAVRSLDEVLECHHVTGDDSYLLKVRTSGTRSLERLITEGLKRQPGVVRTRTTVVLSTVKETLIPPLGEVTE